ncbi:twin-arginine translocation pathway signal protein [Roseibium sp. M-1]
MKKPETARPEEGTGRRDFLKLAAISAPVAVTAVTAGTVADAAEPDLASNKMQDTAHTRAYFDSARF